MNHGITRDDGREESDACVDHRMVIGADHDDGPEARALYREFRDFSQLNVHAVKDGEVDVSYLEGHGTYTIGTDLWFNLFVSAEQAKEIHRMLGDLIEENEDEDEDEEES